MEAFALAPLRVLLYSHDSQGLGHLRRNLALAHSLAQHLPRRTGRPVTGMMITGLDVAAVDLPDGFDVVRMPGITKRHGAYAPREVLVPMPDLTDLREQLLTAAVVGFEPDLMIIDRHIYGIDHELRVPLTALRLACPEAQVVLGLREVLDSPRVASAEWLSLGDVQALRQVIDRIWVYGDAGVHDPRATGEIPVGLHDLIQFTGYLSQGRPGGGPAVVAGHAPYLLTMVGGGSDGRTLCEAAAQAQVPPGYRHILVTGPQVSARDHQAVSQMAAHRTEVLRRVPDGLAAIRGASGLVAMAGYNTVAEVLSTEVPALLVPREVPRMEQSIRCQALLRVGAVDVLPPGELTSGEISRWMVGAVGRTVDRSGIDRAGLSAVPRLATILMGLSTVDEGADTEPLESTDVAV
ncbi:MAG: glycosyl transferase family 28 [Ornithinimicrobium sp.]